MDKRIHFLEVLGGDVEAGVEVPDAAAESRRELTDVEIRYRADAGLASDDLLTGRLQVVTNRGDDAHPRDHDASGGHPWMNLGAGPDDQAAAVRWVM